MSKRKRLDTILMDRGLITEAQVERSKPSLPTPPLCQDTLEPLHLSRPPPPTHGKRERMRDRVDHDSIIGTKIDLRKGDRTLSKQVA